MGKEVDYKKFTWVIKDFCSLQSGKIYSDEFVADGCKWRLLAFPKGNGVKYLSLYLDVAGAEFLPDGWRRHADFKLSVVNQLSEDLFQTKGLNLNWLKEKLEQVSEKKEKEEAGETRVQEIEEDLKKLKQKCSDMEAQLEKEKADVSVARAPLSFDDVV
ncbi:PREDICTED: MATH domain and coiled-coil domain-containing protein At3g58270-like [Camelina sativa]|uniref:MATH domain and coiled-coil domain-containing protein At3g58270-like n=1 Tax=Camelina sativa TaxID=90675 RepID=A0ABM0TKH9_CAMSA|nr:PREDICTED: MATH domain and coiled-coil domain-containing protein At3g58270-like [Camelina sativa]